LASIGIALAAAVLAGCGSAPQMPPVAHVDIDRFMGRWYVIAAIPSPPEREAFNAVETYVLRSDGKIQTTFRYRDGAYDGKLKSMHPVGIVQPDTGNAIWGMQFIWPINAEYVIAHLEPDYSAAIVGRSKRDYVWIMARTPVIPEAEYKKMVARVAALGYSLGKLRKVPQQWPEVRQP
jgi:apolipoprotein D and lipocalin family protein